MSAIKRDRTKSELEDVKKFWYDKLKKSGFVDIEDSKQRLKSPNIRTLAYTNQEIIREFFLKLDSFLNENKKIPALHRKVLEHYSNGERINSIAKVVDRTTRTVNRIITRYKREVLNGHLI